MIIEEINNEEINDIDEMNDALSEMFNSFLIVLEGQEGMTREPTEDDYYAFDGNVSFMWSDKACRLIDEEHKRLYQIAIKYFPESDLDINIESSMYRED